MVTGWWKFDGKLHPWSCKYKNMQVKWDLQHCHKVGCVSSTAPLQSTKGLLRADEGQEECLKNSTDAQNLRFSSTHLSSLFLFVHSNLKTFHWCMPEATKWKTLKIAPLLNTRLQLTTVWSGCWLPNRSSCHDLRDTWNSTLGLSSPRHHPLRLRFMEETYGRD